MLTRCNSQQFLSCSGRQFLYFSSPGSVSLAPPAHLPVFKPPNFSPSLSVPDLSPQSCSPFTILESDFGYFSGLQIISKATQSIHLWWQVVNLPSSSVIASASWLPSGLSPAICPDFQSRDSARLSCLLVALKKNSG